MPSPQTSKSAVASVKSKISWEAMERGLTCFENITNAADGVDQLGLERIVHLCAQTAHNHIDHLRVSFESDFPHLFCNLIARNFFPGRTNQMREQEKFLRCEIERSA